MSESNITQSLGPTSTTFTDFFWPEFSLSDRYNSDAAYNEAQEFEWPQNLGLPIVTNFSYPDVMREDVLRSAESNGRPLSVYPGLQAENNPGSNQWDSFPAGEAQQFLITSVDQATLDAINPETVDGTEVTLDVVPTSTLDRPYTLSLTVTPYNAGPIPHTHWGEDEWFIVLQGEMDAWLPLSQAEPYAVGEIPGQNVPLIEEYHYVHLTPGQAGFLPAGFTHSYRNTSPTGEPLIFLTIWSRTEEFPGGIEEFFTQPGIGVFFDTANEAAGFGSLYNKDPGSPEGDRLEQRFIDYFNLFPNYFVSLSQNFGNYLAEGGNWNPAIPEDTQPIPVPPPTNPYSPPAPNFASQTVNFNAPLDPGVIKRISVPVAGENAQQIVDLVNSYNLTTQQQQGNLFTDFYQDPTNPQNYLLIEQWQDYSNVDQYQESASYQLFLNQLNALVGIPVNPTIETIDTDTLANDQKVLIGKFQAREGTREQIQQLTSELTQQTITNERGNGNIAFEVYEDPQQPNQYLFYEKYDDGAALTRHLETTYTRSFFEGFAPLLEGNGIVDADVNVYSVHTPGSPLDGIYQGQKEGLELLEDLLQDTPELSVSLTANQGIVAMNNQAFTPGIGINLLFTAENSSNQPIEYGIFQVDDSNNSVNGLLPGTPGYLEAVKQRSLILFNTTIDNGFGLSNPSRNIPVQTTQNYAIYQVFGGSIQDVNPVVNFSFQDPQFFSQSIVPGEEISFQFGNGLGGSIELNGPVQNFQDTISQLQPLGFNLLDTSTIVDRQIATDIELVKDSDLIHQIGFYPVVNPQGAVFDPVTNTLVNPGDPNYTN
ncbi:MAG: hypothetical protein F6K48_05075, partial [Okeania sp. SIO3H1]|nr:hypothetical protein [Okeania sp. SIO3H1]